VLNPSETSRAPSGRQGFRTAVVTGAARGIGSAIAARLAQDNFNLFLVDLDEKVMAVADSLPSAVGLVADLAQENSASLIVTETVKAWGALDVLINNAASPGPSDEVASLSRKALHELFETNVSVNRPGLKAQSQTSANFSAS
jgi:NAD(P)-dependent dehydrogenase (short-subunit alcohol dehydrogenase family)